MILIRKIWIESRSAVSEHPKTFFWALVIFASCGYSVWVTGRPAFESWMISPVSAMPKMIAFFASCVVTGFCVFLVWQFWLQEIFRHMFYNIKNKYNQFGYRIRM